MKRNDRVFAALNFLVLAGVYWNGRSFSFGAGDSPQHVLSALTWGVSWPPGYPLYTMLAHFFSMLPLGTPEGSVNGFSGLCHAATCALLFLLLRRQGLERGPAVCAVAFMAFSPLFWYYSEVAEVRALNDLLAVLAAYCAFGWTKTKRSSWLYALGMTFGLGISHHPTYVLILPALVFLLWRTRTVPPLKKAAVGAAVALAFCALPYLILGARLHVSAPIYNPFGVATWRDVLDLFLRKNLGGPLRMVGGRGFFDLGGFRLEPFVAQAGWLIHSAWVEPGAAGALLAVIGLSRWPSKRGPLEFWTAWLGVCLCAFLFISSQQLHLHDPEYARAIAMRFYLMPFLGLFSLIGFGAQALLDRARRSTKDNLGLALAALLPAAFGLGRWYADWIDLRGHDPLLDYGRDILESSDSSDVVLLASDDTVLVENYLDYVRHETGDRIFLNPVLFGSPHYLAELAARYPQLNLPSTGPAGLPMDWHLWQKLNPGRKFYSEVMFSAILSKQFKGLSPHGALLALSDEPARGVREEAVRFLTGTRIARIADAGLYRYTQELYLARTADVLLAFYGGLLDPKKDADLLETLRLRLSGY